MAKKLPPITELSECPNCGGDEFFVMQRYRGQGPYNRRFDRKDAADNTEMYNCLNETAGKTAFCCDCRVAIAKWDQDTNNKQYNEFSLDRTGRHLGNLS